MENRFKFTTAEEQIVVLKSKGLTIQNETAAADLLHTYGYYNIVNSYKTPYLIEQNGVKVYRPGTSFEQIYSLSTFDRNIRNAIMAAMLDLEQHIKAVSAEVIAEAFGTNQADYLQMKNYRDRRISQDRFSLASILETLRKALNSGKDPIKYYHDNYGVIPPWILFKGIYFSTIINFIRTFKDPQKERLVQKIYGCSQMLSAQKNTKDLLSDTLFICLEYRNLCAHGGRVYNYDSNYEIHHHYETALDCISPELVEFHKKHGISKLLILLNALNYKQPFHVVSNAITVELNRHLSNYPDDYKILGDIIGICIFSKTTDVILIDGEQYPITTIRTSDSPVFVSDIPPELKNLYFDKQ